MKHLRLDFQYGRLTVLLFEEFVRHLPYTIIIFLTFTPTDTNYNAKNITLTVNITSKEVPVVTVNPITVIYDGNPVPASKITGSATFGADSVDGSFSWKGTPAITNVADSGNKTVTFTPSDTSKYESVDVNKIGRAHV